MMSGADESTHMGTSSSVPLSSSSGSPFSIALTIAICSSVTCKGAAVPTKLCWMPSPMVLSSVRTRVTTNPFSIFSYRATKARGILTDWIPDTDGYSSSMKVCVLPNTFPINTISFILSLSFVCLSFLGCLISFLSGI